MNMEFNGRKLRQLRRSKDLTMVQFSELCGITQGNISLIENNKSNPTLETAEKLAKALGVDPILFYRDDLVPITDEVICRVPKDLKEMLAREDIVPYLKLNQKFIDSGIPVEDLEKIFETYASLLCKMQEQPKAPSQDR